jgi:hypothetical protein
MVMNSFRELLMPKNLIHPLGIIIACIAVVGVVQAQTIIEVSSDVIRPASSFEPLGVNNFGDVGGTHHTRGNLIANAGFEPIRMRDIYHVIDSGEGNGRRWISLDGSGTSRWLLYTNGTYSGATMRAYRFVDAEGKPLDYKEAGWAQGGKILDASRAASIVPLFTTRVLPRSTPGFPDGGWLAPAPATYKEWQDMAKDEQEETKKGWRVYYEGKQPLRMDDVVIFERSFVRPVERDFHPRCSEKGVGGVWNDVVGHSRQIPISADAPEEMDGGKGVLELTPMEGRAEIWHKLFGGPGRRDAFWYGTLEEGLKYRYEAWVKEVGASGGKVSLGFGGNRPRAIDRGYFGEAAIVGAFPVSGEWMKVGFEFTAPPTPPEGGIEGAIVRYAGSGRLLLDNVRLQPVYEKGDEQKAFVVYRKLFQTLMDTQPATGRKGAARVWFGLNSASMESLCDWNPENSVRLSGGTLGIVPHTKITLPKALSIIEATGDSRGTRMVPWLITQITHREEEYLQLVEYLSAPYDPAKDTPQSKPMAYKRYRQRGNGRPWTEDFREIIIEFGNENWHNRANVNWLGLGRHGTVHQAGREFGLWGAYMIGEMKKSPHWNERKLRVCFGGNYSAKVNSDGSVSGYGQEATVAAKGVNDYHSHATYIGPRWETGEKSQTTIDDSGVQKTLFAYRLQKEEEWARQAATDERLREMGFQTRMSAYEGGPSGFGLRAKTPEEDRAGEYYGKSFAMGTAMLDAWLDAWAKGWTYQCYLSFAQGRWWSSHTSLSQGHRPSPGWLVQTLINRSMANLDMLTVTVIDSPTQSTQLPRSSADIRRNKPPTIKEIPVVRAHATGDAKRIAVAVVNLDLHKAHSVEVRLPMASVGAITRYYLKGDPRDTNLDEAKVTLASEKLDWSAVKDGRFRAELRPGTGSVFVFEK